MEGQSCLLSGGAPDSPVCHRTATVHVRCSIPFQIGRSRPLMIGGSWRTGQSGALCRPLERATRRPRIWWSTVVLAAVGSPDSPVHHRTSTVHCPVRISFLKWHSRPLQNCSRWRTGHCPVLPADRWLGPRSARGLRDRPLRWRPLAHRTVRCTTRQSSEL